MAITIELDCWYKSPVFCPFCGNEADAGGEGCVHYLYAVALGEFQVMNERFVHALNLPDELLEWLPALPRDFIAERGGLESIMDSIADDEFPNHIRFESSNSNDTEYIGFAARPEELSFWGHDPIEPWS